MLIFVERLWDFVHYYFPKEEQRLYYVFIINFLWRDCDILCINIFWKRNKCSIMCTFYTKKLIFEHFCECETKKNSMRNLLCNTCLRMSAVCATQQCWIKYLRTQLCEELYFFITYVNSALMNVHIAQIRIKMCKSHNIHTFLCGGCEILCINIFQKRNKVETSSP